MSVGLSRRVDRTAAVVALGFLGVMVVWPLVAIATRSLAGVGLAEIGEIVRRPSVWRVIRFTLWQAALSTVATMALGLPIAHLLSRYRLRGSGALRVLVVVPFVLPSLVVAAAFSALIDRLGLSIDGSLLGIVAAHVFFNLAVVVRVVGGYWSGLDRTAEEAAAVLGASPRRVFIAITLRRLAPVISGAAMVVFLFCLTSYGIILVLGGPTVATVETEIRRYAIFRSEFDVAAVLAFIQLGFVSVLSWASGRLQRRLSVAGRSRRVATTVSVDRWRRRLYVALVLGLVVIVVVGPMVALIEQSLQVGDGYGFDHYRELAEPLPLLPVSPGRALWQSLRLAVVAAVISLAVGVPAARAVAGGGRLGRTLEAVALVPLGVSAATLGFGYLLAFAVFDLRQSWWLLPLAHAVIGLPFVLAAVVPALRAIDPRIEQAAAMLGASPSQVIGRIEWPLAQRAVATGAGFAFAVSLGEFGATSFLSRRDDAFTVPLAVFRLLSQPGVAVRRQAMALSVIIGLVVGVVATVLELQRMRDREQGEAGTLL